MLALENEESQLQRTLIETKLAVEKQRVPETMELMKATAEVAMLIGNFVVGMIEPILAQIESSPSEQKIALVYWSLRDEIACATQDTAREVQEAADRSKFDSTERKYEERKKKIRDHKAIELEKQKAKQGQQARLEGEQAYKAECGDNFKKDECEAAGQAACVECCKALDQEFKGWVKERDERNNQRKLDMKREQAAAAAQNEAEFNEQIRAQEGSANLLPEEEVETGLLELIQLNAEDIILRWIKYHLRRTCWKGYQFRRKVENYRDDFRDGVAYLALFKRVLHHVYPRDVDLENEIDPQVFPPYFPQVYAHYSFANRQGWRP